jgi:hypothetical protein
MIEKLFYLRKKIKLVGRLPDASEIKKKLEIANLERNDARCIIFPDNKYKQRWDLFIAALLLITAVYVPLRVSFYDQTSISSLVFDTMFDLAFVLDIILTFFTALTKRAGLFETRHRYIAKEYFKMWFWIDLLCSIPVQLLEVLPIENYDSETKSLKVLRLLRLPRLWRIVRLVRLLKKRDS